MSTMDKADTLDTMASILPPESLADECTHFSSAGVSVMSRAVPQARGVGWFAFRAETAEEISSELRAQKCT